MSNTELRGDHEDLRQLIPWYLNGTLTPSEESSLRDHLDGCEDCRSDLAVHEQMQAAVTLDHTTPITPSASAAALIEGVAARERSTNVWSSHWRLAAAIVFAILIGALAWNSEFLFTAENEIYQTATSTTDEPQIGYVLRVQFSPDVPQQSRQRIITELGGEDPRALGDPDHYEMLVRMPTSSVEELGRYTKEAQTRSEILSAEFVALQLPVR